MPRACREYISLQASSKPEDNFWRNRAIAEELQQLIRGKRIGVKVVTLHSPADIEQEALDEDEILAASEGRLPVTFVNVTFHTEELGGADLAEWEQHHELRLLGEMVTRHDS